MAKIIHHEDWQKEPMVSFVNHYLVKASHRPSPSLEGAEGEIEAIINQGRWLVECPTLGCGGALVVSEKTPFFFCPYCTNEGNAGKWLKVKYPLNKRAIEIELLKRPARRDFEAIHRNWRPGESLDKLKAENKMMGIS